MSQFGLRGKKNNIDWAEDNNCINKSGKEEYKLN